MAWTSIPSDYATGHLVTASEWNTFVFDNPAYLKGKAGEVEIENDLVAIKKLFAGPRAAIHKYIREVVINWESDSFGTYSIDPVISGSGTAEMGGFGQCRLKIQNNLLGSVYIKQLVEQNNALDVSFNAGRSPYYRQEFAINRNVADIGVFIGLRQTPSAVLPVTAENYCGLVWTGSLWQFQAANGSSVDASGTQTIVVNTRYVIELLLISATSVECYLNGALIDTLTVVPTGNLDWSVLLEGDAGGAATDTNLTLGKVILQEDLS